MTKDIIRKFDLQFFAGNSNVITSFDYATDRVGIDVAQKIIDYEPKENLFTVLLAKTRKVGTKALKVEWYDEDPNAVWTKINHVGGYADVDTAIVVDDASLFRDKDIFQIPRTKEQIRVVSVNLGTNTLTVARGYGETAAAAINDDDWVLHMGNAMEANSRAPESRAVQPVECYNLVQEIRTPFEGSWESEDMEVRTESERTRLTRTKLKEHRRIIERIGLFGQRKNDPALKNRTAGGALSFIKTNWIDAGLDPTEDEFEEICQTAFQYGSNRKLLIASPKMLTIINKYGREKIETRSNDDTYGMRLKYYKSAHGDLIIVPTRTFEKFYANYSMILDPEYIDYMPFAGHDTKWVRNIQENDLHGWKDEYWTQMTWRFRAEKAHTVIYNI